MHCQSYCFKTLLLYCLLHYSWYCFKTLFPLFSIVNSIVLRHCQIIVHCIAKDIVKDIVRNIVSNVEFIVLKHCCNIVICIVLVIVLHIIGIVCHCPVLFLIIAKTLSKILCYILFTILYPPHGACGQRCCFAGARAGPGSA